MAADAPTSTLTDFAEALLSSGKDRIPYRIDRRRENLLRRWGLLAYPDGTFGLSEEAIENAVRTWGVVLRDPHGNPERLAELQHLVDAGKRWLSSHQDPSLSKLRFGELPYVQYRALWQLVTDWKNELWLESSSPKRELQFWETLAKKGWCTFDLRGSTYMVAPTQKTKDLVAEVGSPVIKTARFRLRSSAVRVASRFRKLPVEIDAVQIDHEESVDTLEGTMTGNPGDWKVTGVDGEQYFVAKAIFKKTYEPADKEAEKAWHKAYRAAY